MFNTKNLSPHQLSFYTALVLSIPIALASWFLEPVWWITILVFAIIFCGSYLLIKFTLEKFIYRKIKLIYKFIYQTKASLREETYYKYILPQKKVLTM